MRKSNLLKTLLPQVEIKLEEKAPLNPQKLFDSRVPSIWLEVGFGGGEHLAAQAKNNPHIGIIGCEPFINGVASALDHIEREQLKNVRIFPDDARPLMDALPEGSIERCFVLFADPWPKARHVERRFIGPANMSRIARVIARNGELRLATDDAQLAVWMKETMDGASQFKLVSHSSTPPADWVQTRYEQKGIKAGRQPVYMCYRRI